MLKILKQFLLMSFVSFSFGTFLVVSLAAKEGPESGGGGTVVYLNSKPQLIDFYTIDGGAKFLSNRYSESKASFLQFPTKFDLERGLEYNAKTAAAVPALSRALDIFNEWSLVPFDTLGIRIHGAFYKPTRWSFTRKKISEYQFYRPDVLPENIVTKPVAYYSYSEQEKIFQVNISLDIWNQLSLQDQVGLLIHETLRHVQIGLGFEFNDKALQRATAVMLVCEPSVKYNQYLFDLLNNRPDLVKQSHEEFNLFVKECREIK